MDDLILLIKRLKSEKPIYTNPTYTNKTVKTIPKFIVFDFHRVISLKEGSNKLINNNDVKSMIEEDQDLTTLGINNLKNGLRKYKLKGETKTDWYELMKRSNINPDKMIPTLDVLINFIETIKGNHSHTLFGIGSMGESEQFIIDMLKYAFEYNNKTSPFNKNNVVSSISINKYGSRHEIGKLKHIYTLQKNLGVNYKNNEIALIDDNYDNIADVSMEGVCGVLIHNFFNMEDWNNRCYSN